ncbi:tyrosine-type recombinase/integrase [Nocardioides pakistanensis]
MARPPLPIGAHGNIFVTQEPNGVWRARTRFRDLDGRVRPVEKSGHTAAAAKRILQEALTERVKAMGSTDLQPTTPFKDLVDFWLEDLAQREDAPRPATLDKYRTTLSHLVESMGGLQLREATAGRIDSHLKALPSPDMRRKARSHLMNMFDLAVIHEAVPTNPVLSTSKHKRRKRDVEDIPMDAIESIRQAVRDAMTKKRSGPKTSGDMADIIDLLLATGCRIGEILALRWEDCDLTTRRPTITVTGSIKYEKGKGNYRDVPKTRASNRTFVLPPFAAQMLRRRKMAQAPNPLGAVFVTRNGTWHQLSNIERRWRMIRSDAGLDWVKFHSFRRTVATQVDAVVDKEAAARLLGHASSAITEAHYINRKPEVVDLSAVIEERFAPKHPDEGPTAQAQ